MNLFEIEKNEQSSKVLKKITLQNYRNHAFKEIHVGESGVIFKGMNGIGKTNIIEAIYWVLSGRLFNGLSLGHLIGVTPENAEKGTKTSVKLEWENFSFEKVVYEKYREDLYEGIEVRVFNKWGEEIFSSIGEYTPWDGTYRSNPLPAGVYYYVIYLRDSDDTKFTGSITIIR